MRSFSALFGIKHNLIMFLLILRTLFLYIMYALIQFVAVWLPLFHLSVNVWNVFKSVYLFTDGVFFITAFSSFAC